MASVRKSIIVDAPVELVFKISNDLSLWPTLMPEYSSVEELDREGSKITFQLTHESGLSWTSHRYLFPDEGVAVAERDTPREPFVYMQMVWTYEKIDVDVTRMTWSMLFEPSADSDIALEDWLERLSEHGQGNQLRMKAYIESEFYQRTARRGRT